MGSDWHMLACFVVCRHSTVLPDTLSDKAWLLFGNEDAFQYKPENICCEDNKEKANKEKAILFFFFFFFSSFSFFSVEKEISPIFVSNANHLQGQVIILSFPAQMLIPRAGCLKAFYCPDSFTRINPEGLHDKARKY